MSPAFLMLGLVGLVGVPERQTCSGLCRILAFPRRPGSRYCSRRVGHEHLLRATERLRGRRRRAGNDLDVFLRAAGKVLGTPLPTPSTQTRPLRTHRSLPGFWHRCMRSAVRPPVSSGQFSPWGWLPSPCGCSSCATGAATRFRSCFSSRGARSTSGTIEPLLLLVVAAAWHWRDRRSGERRSGGARDRAEALPLATRRLAGAHAQTPRRLRRSRACGGARRSELGRDRLCRAHRLSRRSAAPCKRRVDLLVLRRRSRGARAPAAARCADRLGAGRRWRCSPPPRGLRATSSEVLGTVTWRRSR